MFVGSTHNESWEKENMTSDEAHQTSDWGIWRNEVKMKWKCSKDNKTKARSMKRERQLGREGGVMLLAEMISPSHIANNFRNRNVIFLTSHWCFSNSLDFTFPIFFSFALIWSKLNGSGERKKVNLFHDCQKEFFSFFRITITSILRIYFSFLKCQEQWTSHKIK